MSALVNPLLTYEAPFALTYAAAFPLIGVGLLGALLISSGVKALFGRKTGGLGSRAA